MSYTDTINISNTSATSWRKNIGSSTASARKIINEWFSIDVAIITSTQTANVDDVDKTISLLAKNKDFNDYIAKTNDEIIKNAASFEDIGEKYK
ncbi:MAG: hypothetical protein ACR2LN_03300 [Candidatus Levyibacteriota bacterium]